MASSIRRVREISGSQFGASIPVEHAGGDVAEQAASKLKLPISLVALLADLRGLSKDPDVSSDLKLLMGRALQLEQQIAEIAETVFAMRRADLEAQHEDSKRAVREQGAVLDGLTRKVAEDTQGWLRADNDRRKAESVAWKAEQDLKGLSRFASKKQIAEAEKRVSEANKKMKAAQTEAASLGSLLNSLKIVTIPAEQKKLNELKEKELELRALLLGQDPDLARFGFLQR